MEPVKTARELGSQEPKVGYEWGTDFTSPLFSVPGQWIVRRDPYTWTLLFRHSTPIMFDQLLQTYPPTEEGERLAKQQALFSLAVASGNFFAD
jgi:hypothetical protein